MHSEKVPIQRSIGLQEDQYQPNLNGPVLCGTPGTEKDLSRWPDVSLPFDAGRAEAN